MLKDRVYIGMANMPSEQRENLRHVNDLKEYDVVKVKDKSLLDEIFAPHPLTGNPCSDLFFDAKADPNLKDFIARELQSTRLQIEKTDNIDDALEFTKSVHESVDRYFERVRGYFSQSKED